MGQWTLSTLRLARVKLARLFFSVCQPTKKLIHFQKFPTADSFKGTDCPDYVELLLPPLATKLTTNSNLCISRFAFYILILEAFWFKDRKHAFPCICYLFSLFLLSFFFFHFLVFVHIYCLLPHLPTGCWLHCLLCESRLDPSEIQRSYEKRQANAFLRTEVKG